MVVEREGKRRTIRTEGNPAVRPCQRVENVAVKVLITTLSVSHNYTLQVQVTLSVSFTAVLRIWDLSSQVRKPLSHHNLLTASFRTVQSCGCPTSLLIQRKDACYSMFISGRFCNGIFCLWY